MEDRGDFNEQDLRERDCVTCGRTLRLDPRRPGWTPLPGVGWRCPDCTRQVERDAPPA